MSRAWTLACIAASAPLLGCVSVLPKAAPVQLYRFGVGGEATPVSPAAPAIALGSLVLPRAAAGDGLLTLSGDRAAFVAGARWVAPAAVLMREATVKAFAARGGVRLVGGDTPSSARLDILVTDFAAEYAAAGAPPTVHLELIASLTPRAGSPASRVVRVQQPARENRLSAIVPAYDAAVTDALTQVAAWTERQPPSTAQGADTRAR